MCSACSQNIVLNLVPDGALNSSVNRLIIVKGLMENNMRQNHFIIDYLTMYFFYDYLKMQ